MIDEVTGESDDGEEKDAMSEADRRIDCIQDGLEGCVCCSCVLLALLSLYVKQWNRWVAWAQEATAANADKVRQIASGRGIFDRSLLTRARKKVAGQRH